MTTTTTRAVSLFLSLLALTPPAAHAQSRRTSTPGYDKHLAANWTMVALRDDMHRLDQQLVAISTRPEYRGLERLAADIRYDVRVQEDQAREHLAGRHDGPVGGTAVVNWLRHRVARLRRSITALPPQPVAAGK